MYGTVARMLVIPGKEQDVPRLTKEWTRERGAQAQGFVVNYLFKSDSNRQEYYLVAIFEDRASYVANADEPEQQAWHERLRVCLSADPEWHDGDVVDSGSA